MFPSGGKGPTFDAPPYHHPEALQALAKILDSQEEPVIVIAPVEHHLVDHATVRLAVMEGLEDEEIGFLDVAEPRDPAAEVEVLLMDGFHNLSSDAADQETLFKILSRFKRFGKRLLAFSDQDPEDLEIAHTELAALVASFDKHLVS